MLLAIKKVFFSFLLFIVLPASGLAQDLYTFTKNEYVGNIDSFQKFNHPDAVVLYEFTDFQLNDLLEKKHYYIKRKFKIKILNKKGFAAALIKIPYIYEEQFEEIQKIEGRTINNLNGVVKISKVDNEQIFTNTENQYIKTVSFTFPELTDSSVLEYSYTIKRKSNFYLPPVVLHHQYPTLKNIVLLEKYSIYTNAKYKGKHRFQKEYVQFQNDIISVIDEKSPKCNRVCYILSDIDNVPEEPYTDGNIADYMDRLNLAIELLGTMRGNIKIWKKEWVQINEELFRSRYFGQQVTKTLLIPALDSQLNTMKDTLEKVKLIFNHVIRNYRFTKEYNIFSRELEEVVKTKEGNIGELNLLLVNYLTSYNIYAFPVLGRMLNSGKIDKENPSILQFNFTGAMVPLHQKIYILDASNKFGLYDLPPKEINTTDLLVLSNYDFVWKNDWEIYKNNKHLEDIELTIDSAGTINGTAILTSYGYERTDRLAAMEKNKADYVKEYFDAQKFEFTGFSLSDHSATDSTKLVQKATFGLRPTISNTYLYFNPYRIFPHLITNPFIADKRVTPINFRTAKELEIKVTIKIPPNYRLNTTITDGRLINADQSMVYEKKVLKDKKSITIKNNFYFKKIKYDQSEYFIVKEYFKNLIDLLNQSIVLEKIK